MKTTGYPSGRCRFVSFSPLHPDSPLGYDPPKAGALVMAARKARGTGAIDVDPEPRVQTGERRQWERALVDLEVDYGNEENYLFAYIRDISATGIFVRTNSP